MPLEDETDGEGAEPQGSRLLQKACRVAESTSSPSSSSSSSGSSSKSSSSRSSSPGSSGGSSDAVQQRSDDSGEVGLDCLALTEALKTVRSLGIPFRAAAMLTITSALLAVCVCMFLPRSLINRRFTSFTLKAFQMQSEEHRRVVNNLTAAAALWAYENVITQVSLAVQDLIVVPPRQVVDDLWSSMQTLHLASPDWDGKSYFQRKVIMTRCFEMLAAPEPGAGRPYSIFIAFETEEHCGAQVNASGYAMFDAPGGVHGRMTTTETWRVDSVTGERIGHVTVEPYLPTSRPWYHVQSIIAAEARALRHGGADVPRTSAWSAIYPFMDDTGGQYSGATWTEPIAYCGNYSCFCGVLASSVSLKVASTVCASAWSKLAETLRGGLYQYSISNLTSSVFIVSHVSHRYPEQQGLLVGASYAGLRNAQMSLLKATESENWITATTAHAILARFGAWNATELVEEKQIFRFAVDANGRLQVDANGRLQTHYEPGTEAGRKFRVACRSVWLDDKMRWLVVVTLPAEAFSNSTDTRTQQLYADARRTELQSIEDGRQRTTWNAAITGLIAAVCVVTGFFLSGFITKSLVKLGKSMKQLARMNFSREASEFDSLVSGRRSRIHEVAKLQHEFARLSTGMSVFARFVPETIVQNLVSGPHLACRPHVEKRNVTIMFSAIKNFNEVSDALTEDDLLQVLTQYLTDMTDVVESFEGVVAEILGDGLLAYWNAPSDVPDHAPKACEAVLTMHTALEAINEEFVQLELPELQICSGLNSGDVLSGILGSIKKMKFGCMGDPVNLASRLCGVCRKYSVNAVISGATCDTLPESFVVRRLDKVQVKGRKEPTEIFELIGILGDCVEQPSDDRIAHARIYEEALDAFQEAHFDDACRIAADLLEVRPDDVAARKLLERSQRYLGPDGHTIVGLTREELESWTGVVAMDSK